MDDLLLVGEADDFSGLPEQVDTDIGSEAVAPLGQEMVESQGVRVVLEEDGGANLVLGVAQGPQDVGMLQFPDAIGDRQSPRSRPGWRAS
jgi:hypothetical protein